EPPGSSPSISTLIIPAPAPPPPADQTWKQSVSDPNAQAPPEQTGLHKTSPPGAVGAVHEQITREMPAPPPAEPPASEADSPPSPWIHTAEGPAAQTDTLSGPPVQPVTSVAGPPPAPPAPAASTPGANGSPAPAPPSRGVPHVAGYDI